MKTRRERMRRRLRDGAAMEIVGGDESEGEENKKKREIRGSHM